METPEIQPDQIAQNRDDANASTPFQGFQSQAPANTPQVPAPAPAQPAQSFGTPQAQAQTGPPQLAQKQSLFTKILQGLGGGPRYVTNPNTGEQQEVPTTKGQIGRSILAGAIHGLLAGAVAGQNAPDGPAGTRGPGNAAAMQAGFQAGEQNRQAFQQAPQAAADADQLRKFRGMQATQLEVQNQVAISKLNEDNWTRSEEHYTKMQDVFRPTLESFEESDAARTAGEPSLFVDGARKLSHIDAMKQMEGHQGEYMPIQDGWTQETDKASGNIFHVPTYSLVRTTGTINVNREALEALAQYNGQVAKLLNTSSDPSVKLSSTMLVGLEKDAHQGIVAEQFVNDIRAGIDKSLEGEEGYKPLGKVSNFAAAYRDDPGVHGQVDSLMGVLGSYGTHSTVSALSELMAGSKGGALMQFFGISKDALAEFVQGKHDDVIAADAKAKNAGKPVTQAIAEARLADPATPAAERPALQAVLDNANKQAAARVTADADAKRRTPEGQADLQRKQLENIQLSQTIAQNAATGKGVQVPKNFVANPRSSEMAPDDLSKDLSSKGVNIPSNFSALYSIAHNSADLSTLPTQLRKGVSGMTRDQGLSYIRTYINPQYNEGDYSASKKLSAELASTRIGTAGGTLLSAGTAANHLNLLEQAGQALNNKDTQLLNQIANTYGVAVGKSPAVTFQAIAEQVNNEVAKVVAGGQPNEPELKANRETLNTNQSPEQVRNVIRAYIGLMNGRIGEIDDRSMQYFGRHVKGISPEVASVFNKYGFNVPGQTQQRQASQGQGKTSQGQGQSPRLAGPVKQNPFRTGGQ